jgi:hypothetical protein
MLEARVLTGFAGFLADLQGRECAERRGIGTIVPPFLPGRILPLLLQISRAAAADAAKRVAIAERRRFRLGKRGRLEMQHRHGLSQQLAFLRLGHELLQPEAHNPSSWAMRSTSGRRGHVDSSVGTALKYRMGASMTL